MERVLIWLGIPGDFWGMFWLWLGVVTRLYAGFARLSEADLKCSSVGVDLEPFGEVLEFEAVGDFAGRRIRGNGFDRRQANWSVAASVLFFIAERVKN